MDWSRGAGLFYTGLAEATHFSDLGRLILVFNILPPSPSFPGIQIQTDFPIS
jgi:hypothetical protein